MTLRLTSSRRAGTLRKLVAVGTPGCAPCWRRWRRRRRGWARPSSAGTVRRQRRWRRGEGWRGRCRAGAALPAAADRAEAAAPAAPPEPGRRLGRGSRRRTPASSRSPRTGRSGTARTSPRRAKRWARTAPRRHHGRFVRPGSRWSTIAADGTGWRAGSRRATPDRPAVVPGELTGSVSTMTNIRTGRLLISLGVAGLLTVAACGGAAVDRSGDTIPAGRSGRSRHGHQVRQEGLRRASGRRHDRVREQGAAGPHPGRLSTSDNKVVGDTLKVEPGPDTRAAPTTSRPAPTPSICDIPGHKRGRHGSHPDQRADGVGLPRPVRTAAGAPRGARARAQSTKPEMITLRTLS